MYTGLTTTQAAIKLKEQGKNAIPEAKHRFLTLFLRQFKGIFNILLISAAAVLGCEPEACFQFYLTENS